MEYLSSSSSLAILGCSLFLLVLPLPVMAEDEAAGEGSWELPVFLIILLLFSKLVRHGSSSFKTTCW